MDLYSNDLLGQLAAELAKAQFRWEEFRTGLVDLSPYVVWRMSGRPIDEDTARGVLDVWLRTTFWNVSRGYQEVDSNLSLPAGTSNFTFIRSHWGGCLVGRLVKGRNRTNEHAVIARVGDLIVIFQISISSLDSLRNEIREERIQAVIAPFQALFGEEQRLGLVVVTTKKLAEALEQRFKSRFAEMGGLLVVLSCVHSVDQLKQLVNSQCGLRQRRPGRFKI